MPNKKNNRDGRDSSKVSGSESWEINYMKQKFNVTDQQVSGVIRVAGNSQKKMEEYLRDRTK
jgi:hypothetical protein